MSTISVFRLFPADEGWEFPYSLEGAAARHRSGGPYVPESAIEAAARASAGCPLDGQPAYGETRCERVVVKFFERYEDAYRRYASTGWQYVGTFAHDREVYLVTVYGHLGFCPKVPSEPGQLECPLYADHSNGIYDATTGEGGGGGTAGAPLE